MDPRLFPQMNAKDLSYLDLQYDAKGKRFKFQNYSPKW